MTDQRPPNRVVYMIVLADVFLIVAVVGSYALLNSFLILICGLPLLLGFNYLCLRWRLRKFRPGSELSQGSPSGSALPLYLMALVFFTGTAYGVVLFSAGELSIALFPVLAIPFGFGLYLLRQARKLRVRPPE